MGAGEADTPDALHPADRTEQPREQGPPLGDVTAVGIDVLAQQRHLGDATAGEQFDLCHDVVDGPADFGPAHRGHDAEGARVVTSGLDVDPRRIGQLSDCAETEQRVGARLGDRRAEDLHHGTLGAGSSQQPGRAGEVVRAEDDVDPSHPLLDALPVLLGQASPDGDLQVRFGIDQLLEAPERAVEPLVGVLPDAARVEHHHVGVLHGGGRRQALGHQQPGEPLGVVLVHLAPEGPDEVGAGHPPESRERRRLDFRPWTSWAHGSWGECAGPRCWCWCRWRWCWRRAARARVARPALNSRRTPGSSLPVSACSPRSPPTRWPRIGARPSPTRSCASRPPTACSAARSTPTPTCSPSATGSRRRGAT